MLNIYLCAEKVMIMMNNFILTIALKTLQMPI